MYGIINKTNGQNVKNTMIEVLLAHIAPHHCFGYGQTGTLLCDNCKYNINFNEFYSCLNCGMSFTGNGICKIYCHPYCRMWCIGEWTDILVALIDDGASRV